MVSSRILNFVSKDLGKKAVIMFAFDDLETGEGLFQECYPMCFKLVGLSARGPSHATIHYNNQLSFIKCQSDSPEGVSSSTFVPVQLGQQASLLMSSPDPPATYEFTVSSLPSAALAVGTRPCSLQGPVAGSVDVIIATNKSDERCDIGVGFPIDEHTSQVCRLFKDIGPGGQVVTSFTPVLRGYIASDLHHHRQNQPLSAPVLSPCIFRCNLAELDESTTWLVTRNPQGRWSIDLLSSPSPLCKVVHFDQRLKATIKSEGGLSPSKIGRISPRPTQQAAIQFLPRPLFEAQPKPIPSPPLPPTPATPHSNDSHTWTLVSEPMVD